MFKRFAAIGLVFLLSACAGQGPGSLGALNPANWFRGGAEAVPTTLAPARGYPVMADSRPPVERITALAVERIPSGAIVRATGLPPSQGWHHAGLVLTGISANGTAEFEFRALPPERTMPAGPVHLRELVVAAKLSNTQLRTIRRVSVRARTNSRTARP